MPFRPVTLFGLECILQYLDANKRFETARHCAAIRKIEKRVPLRIDSLELKDCDIAINGTEYHLEVKCPHHSTQRIQYDLDQYCLPITPKDTEATPGDLVFSTFPLDFDNKRRELIEDRKNQLRTMEHELLVHLCSKYLGKNHPFNPENHIKGLKARIKVVKESLEDFRVEKKVVRHPCTQLLQLSIKNGKKQQGVYNMKLAKAMKQLTNFFFSGRRHPIQIRRFQFGRTVEVLRLPEDMKLRVRELDIGPDSNKVCRITKSILTEDSFPLDFVNVAIGSHERFSPHEMIKRAKKVQIRFDSSIDHDVFSGLECLELEMWEQFMDRDHFSNIIQEWLDTQKRVGTRYTFYHQSENRQVLDVMQMRFHGWASGDSSIIIPMGDDSGARIHVSYQRTRGFTLDKLVLEVLAE